MYKPNKKKKLNAHMIDAFPSDNSMSRSNHDYPVCSSLEIGYFILVSGRLCFLPKNLENTKYIIYEFQESDCTE